MARRVKDFVHFSNHVSLDDLIGQLTELRDRLPADSDAELVMRGDDVFGRHLAVSYFRDQTAEEAECDARYGDFSAQAQHQPRLRRVA